MTPNRGKMGMRQPKIWRSSEKLAFIGCLEEPLTFVLGKISTTPALRVSYAMAPDWWSRERAPMRRRSSLAI